MPGLSQLKKFSQNLLSIGDEVLVRSSRGEKPVRVKIPKDLADVDDSEDFVLGMPQNEISIVEEPEDDDLSDLMGTAKASDVQESGESQNAAVQTPDLSSLLNPVGLDNFDSDSDMPDLSMFEDNPVEEVEEVEEEPEEVSIADMSLDALLAGSGFDGSEGKAPSESNEDDYFSDDNDDFYNYDNKNEIKNDDVNVNAYDNDAVPGIDDNLEELDDLEGLDTAGASDLLGEDDTDGVSDSAVLNDLWGGGDTTELDDTPALDTPDLDTAATDIPDISSDASDLSDIGDISDALPDFGDTTGEAEPVDLSSLADFGDLGDLGDTTGLGDLGDTAGVGGTAGLGDLDDTAGVGDTAGLGDLGDSAGVGDTAGLGDLGDIAGLNDDTGLSDLSDAAGLNGDTGLGDIPAMDNISSLDDLLGGDDKAGVDTNAAGDTAGALNTNGASDLLGSDDTVGADTAVGGLDTAVGELDTAGSNDLWGVDDTAGASDSAVLNDLWGGGDTTGMDDFPALDTLDTTSDADDLSNIDDISDALPDFGDSIGDNSASDFSVTDDIPDYDDSLYDDENQEESEVPIEDFDTSAMEDMDFGIQDTDSKLNSGFEMGNNDDFLMEGEFEIPGFSDVSTIKEEKSAPILKNAKNGRKSGKNLPEVDFSQAEESEELPPNTLSDAQYKQFLKNLSEYPLNVRLAFENLIVQDEFTDDAEFEIIEKILNKAPARQVAGFLEKMLDTSIPVPRDYEHRTAEEYEAYKKSLSYQLRNRIIPACLIGITLFLVSLGLFQFSKNCIYKPLKANSLYKHGYALLEADEYPQSEMKFEQAVKYRISKKWFFNYARGYRKHKQYQRASTMYDRILSYFKHDKTAGLEYADMELNEMANYERAEEIVRREVLDYHINDADGILKLGDIFLEWGTEKDPAKLEDAREQYANLLQLYGNDKKKSNLYLSRMMRYFIRTDNLKQVIPLKKVFEQDEKSLCSDDWAELSGYLLDKYYGTLAPSEEYLRYEIEGLRGLLMRAVKTNPDNPIAYYNLAKYFIESGENSAIENTLQTAIEKFNTVPSMKKRDIYKYIDSYRLLGEQYIDMENYLQAQEQFSEGISLFMTERDNAGFEGTPAIGKLYEDMGNIKYSISGDYDDALTNYKYSVELGNDTQNIRYRIGYIQYKKKNYGEALGSFMKAGDGNVKERNLMLAMANTLFMRGDYYAAEGYYSQLIDTLDREIEKRGVVFPQTSIKDYDVVNTYLYAANNYGVTLYNLAKRTGNSALNAQSIVQFSQSVRAWDALTRNQETLERMSGSNLAEQNIQYITHVVPEFEPSIYTDISKTLLDNEKL